MNGVLVLVSVVCISFDMSIVCVYFSVFFFERSQEIVKNINDNMKFICYELGIWVCYQLCIIFELKFFVDDLLDYVECIDELLKKQNWVVNFFFYIVKCYFFFKKLYNVINVILVIFVCGVVLVILVLVCILFVFNGFQDLVVIFFMVFDLELKIMVVIGKVFDGQEVCIEVLCWMLEIVVFFEFLEENVMVQYKGCQIMVVIKGIEDNFEDLIVIDSIFFGWG